mgnify:CR=1 FL=1
MNKNADIVKMRPEDEPDFLALTQAFYRHEAFDFDSAASGRMVQHILANPHVGAVYLARQAGRAVGYMVLTHCYSLEFGGAFVLLDEIFVLPEAQRTGLGKQLLDTASDYCRENSMGTLRLEVQKKNTRAIDVYRTCGFRTEDRYLMSLPFPRAR